MTELSPAIRPVAPDDRPFGTRLPAMGFGLIAVFCATFYLWAATAPIEGAVVAPGVVGVDGNVRVVQHLEGGIVEKILVQDGQQVQSGEVVIRLQSTVPASARNEVLGQYYEARATEARLVAEQTGAARVAFPAELTEKVGDGAVQAAMDGQVSIFDSRKALLAERLTILERTRAGLTAEIDGLKGQIASTDKRLALLAEEREGVAKLLEKNLTSRPRMLALDRQQAELEGNISQYRAAIATAEQKIDEETLRMAEMKNSMATEVVQTLRETRARAYELGQRLAAAEDVVGRTEIRAPVAGVVTGLAVHTVGGVIAAGQPLMNVVPVQDKLVVQATIDPQDIDQVHRDMSAQVWLTATNRRSQTPLEGIVTTVSADRMTDPQTGAAYYQARIELDRDAAAQGNVPLQPGMGAEVMIRTGARTTWDYLTAPVTRFLSRSRREG